MNFLAVHLNPLPLPHPHTPPPAPLPLIVMALTQQLEIVSDCADTQITLAFLNTC